MAESLRREGTSATGTRVFYTIWVGQLISVFGSQLTSFGLAVYLVEQTGRATPFALTVLFANLPGVLLAPLAGSVVDRLPRRLVMILADTGSALVTLAAVGLLLSGRLEAWHIYTMAATGSVFSTFQGPAYMASITMLVPKEQYGRASGMVQMAQALAQLIAPVIAGFLFVTVGLRGIVLTDFATYAFAVSALLIVQIPDPEGITDGKESRSLIEDAVFGIKYIGARRGLLGMLIYFALVNFFANAAGVLGPPAVLATETPAVLGIVQAAAGGGMLAGSLIMSTWGGPKGERNMLAVFGFILLFGVGFLVFGLRPSPWLYGLGLALMLFAVPLASGNSQAIWQRKIPAELQGRVFSTRGMIARGIMPIAFLLAGPLADHVFEPLMAADGGLAPIFGPLIGTGDGRGIGLLFLISGLFIFLATGIAFSIPSIRKLETELPDAVPHIPDDIALEEAEPVPAA